ncbi:hypothetical protein AZE42_13862, partial [Rhizopogon vesiculosus]
MTLVGSAYERKINNIKPIKEKTDTANRLEDVRKLMVKDKFDCYDKRREWIFGFTGSAGQAVVSRAAAYLIIDSQYLLQAWTELDSNWHLIPAGTASVDGPKDWVDWFSIQDCAKDANIGIDACMISHEKAASLNSQL